MTYEQWEALPEHERLDRLAYDYRTQQVIQSVLDMKTSDGKLLVDIGAYSTLKLRQL